MEHSENLLNDDFWSKLFVLQRILIGIEASDVAVLRKNGIKDLVSELNKEIDSLTSVDRALSLEKYCILFQRKIYPIDEDNKARLDRQLMSLADAQKAKQELVEQPQAYKEKYEKTLYRKLKEGELPSDNLTRFINSQCHYLNSVASGGLQPDYEVEFSRARTKLLRACMKLYRNLQKKHLYGQSIKKPVHKSGMRR